MEARNLAAERIRHQLILIILIIIILILSALFAAWHISRTIVAPLAGTLTLAQRIAL